MTKTALKRGLKQGLIVLGLSTVLLLIFTALGGVASAQLISEGDVPSSIAGATGGESSFRSLILNIVNFFLLFLGLIAVIMIIYGGITYVTAAGNQESIDKAKKVIMYAIVGIIIVMISFALVSTVIGGAGQGAEV
jgi:cytochrome bd-type quinol oxidase subunit 2